MEKVKEALENLKESGDGPAENGMNLVFNMHTVGPQTIVKEGASVAANKNVGIEINNYYSVSVF